MKLVSASKSHLLDIGQTWDRFWFTPADPRLLGLIRVCVGSMLFYTHLAWTMGLNQFAGTDGLIPTQFIFNQPEYSAFHWSHLFSIESPAFLLITHVLALIVFGMFTLGLFSRTTAVLSFLLVVSYANRLTLSQFGLDQINAFMAMYLAVGPCGDAFSLDRILKKRNRDTPLINKSILANIAIRLMQVHMCIVYLFAGLSKLRGDRWVGGDAIWGAFASYEYQTLDMTWMANYFWIINALTIGTIVWEITYPAMIWTKVGRPTYLFFAVLTHLGIGICMGMMTFGLIMLYGNMSFLQYYLFTDSPKKPSSEKLPPN